MSWLSKTRAVEALVQLLGASTTEERVAASSALEDLARFSDDGQALELVQAGAGEALVDLLGSNLAEERVAAACDIRAIATTTSPKIAGTPFFRRALRRPYATS